MMKRNILAVVIPALLAAGAANAAEIYNKDGNKLDLYGKVDARHQFSDNAGDDGDKSYVRFGFKGETQITDQLTGYGQWEYNVQANVLNPGHRGSKTRLGFAGLKFADAGSFDYGRNYGVLYDAMSYTDQLPVFGDDTLYQDNDNFMAGRSNGLATYRNSNFFGLVDGLGFAVQYQGKNEGRGPRYDNGDGWGTSLSYDTGMGISAVGAYFSSDRTDQQQLDGNGEKADAYGFGLKYDANNVYLAAFYGESRNLTHTATTAWHRNTPDFANKAQAFEVVAQYQFDFGLRPSIAYLQSKGKDLNGATGTVQPSLAAMLTWLNTSKWVPTTTSTKTCPPTLTTKSTCWTTTTSPVRPASATDDVVGVGLVYQF